MIAEFAGGDGFRTPLRRLHADSASTNEYKRMSFLVSEIPLAVTRYFHQRRDRPDVALGDELASSALNLAKANPRLRPLHLVVRETEFCGLRLAGYFRRRMRENSRNSVRRPRCASLTRRNYGGFCLPGNRPGLSGLHGGGCRDRTDGHRGLASLQKRRASGGNALMKPSASSFGAENDRSLVLQTVRHDCLLACPAQASRMTAQSTTSTGWLSPIHSGYASAMPAGADRDRVEQLLALDRLRVAAPVQEQVHRPLNRNSLTVAL